MATRKAAKSAKTGRFVSPRIAKRKPKETTREAISKVRARRIGKSILRDYADAFRKLEKY